jgi:hypothetical protein
MKKIEMKKIEEKAVNIAKKKYPHVFENQSTKQGSSRFA